VPTQVPFKTVGNAQKCSMLEAQWKDDWATLKNSDGFAKAEKMANSGTKLCSAGRQPKGIEQLRAALR